MSKLFLFFKSIFCLKTMKYNVLQNLIILIKLRLNFIISSYEVDHL